MEDVPSEDVRRDAWWGGGWRRVGPGQAPTSGRSGHGEFRGRERNTRLAALGSPGSGREGPWGSGELELGGALGASE